MNRKSLARSLRIFADRPHKPQGDKVKNWIPTESGRAWFPYFCFYSPKQAFLDHTWVLPDIEKVQ
jgi:hypothetical protein